ncbi:bacillithiol system redox-active protein YtxJ [Cytobacillus gottheilii]|uniref:bacillithiol system redox-active protein YtxJ n=1 Tax=Cytobacillus gottheilii TaxID=859144 RepID=UPI0009BA642A|nr:bacillithiol system redox-active protein YtxJ [Cytobacillus gottheilii]
MERLSSVEAFNEVIKADGTFMLLKHSSTCPISQAAYEEYESFSGEKQDLKTYLLIVQDDRPLSNHIAEEFHIKHESPQSILFKNGDVVWHASHWKITTDSLNQAIEENQ